jgi:Sec-independent protein translocase protein TatA
MLDVIKNISPKELIVLAIIGLILIVFFGNKAVSGLSRTGGETLKEIKKIKKNFTEAIADDETNKSEKEVSKK